MHRTRFGYIHTGNPIEAVSLKGDYCAKSENQLEGITLVEPPIPHNDKTPDKRVHLRGELAPGQSLNGPALIVSSGSTTALEKGWRATVNGDLIANAPHVPVHLGAMSETIRCMLVKFPKMFPGDCFITNDPYEGGSHLPDVTVITPNQSTCCRLFAGSVGTSGRKPRDDEQFLVWRLDVWIL